MGPSGNQLATVSVLRLNFDSSRLKSIVCNEKTRKAIKTKETARAIDLVTLRAQSLRGQGCLASQYFKLKRTCRKLKKNAINLIKSYYSQKEAQELINKQKNAPKGYFSTAISWVKSAIQSKPIELTDISKLFVHIIETYLELGYSKV